MLAFESLYCGKINNLVYTTHFERFIPSPTQFLTFLAFSRQSDSRGVGYSAERGDWGSKDGKLFWGVLAVFVSFRCLENMNA